MIEPKIKIDANNLLNSANIKLSGSLVITTIDKILPEINSAIDKYSKITIEGDNIEEIDLAAIQIFYSIMKTLELEKKEIKIDFNFKDKSAKTVKNSGFANFFNI